jgi:hypothetical protein
VLDFLSFTTSSTTLSLDEDYSLPRVVRGFILDVGSGLGIRAWSGWFSYVKYGVQDVLSYTTGDTE